MGILALENSDISRSASGVTLGVVLSTSELLIEEFSYYMGDCAFFSDVTRVASAFVVCKSPVLFK